MNPYASFDCLAISIRVQPLLGGLSISELNLFAYLACLLSLYKSHPVTDWGYNYMSTKVGAPFSHELTDAAIDLERIGLFKKDRGYLSLTARGRDQYRFLQSLSQNSERDRFVEGACSSVLALPIGMIREALRNEPELNHSTRLHQTKILLEEGPGLQTLYNDFSVLSNAIGLETKDLMVPAVIWLTYLAQVTQHSMPR